MSCGKAGGEKSKSRVNMVNKQFSPELVTDWRENDMVYTEPSSTEQEMTLLTFHATAVACWTYHPSSWYSNRLLGKGKVFGWWELFVK